MDISGLIELGRLATNNVFINEEVDTLKRKLGMLTSSRDDVQFELQRIERSSNKKRKYAVANWLENVENVANKVQSLEAEMRESRLGWNVGWHGRVGNLIEEVDELRGQTFGGELCLDSSSNNERVPFLVSKLVGQSFQVNKTKIWEWIMDDEVLSFGIYGMGGVGKTTLMMHIYNRLLEQRPNNFRNIYWVTVSQDFSTSKLQDQVAYKIGCDLSNENDEKIRAARLSQALEKKGRSVLILDDLWNQFDPNEIGLPIHSGACKLILTTRSLDICRRMSCQKEMKLEPLSSEEPWCLFTDTLGNCATLSFEVKQVAKLVTDECAGLPLGLVALAGSMRGIDDIREWRSVLEQLKDSRIGPTEMEDKVFKVLNLSFDRLRDPELKECFLYCSLFPEDYEIPRKRLIQYLVNEEIIKGPTSRKAQVDRAHALLNKLENACLLQGGHNKYSQSYIKMHDLIRDMAIKKSLKAIVEAGKQLSELPDASRWPTDLTRASFIENNIKKIPGDCSPSCPVLSSLLLSKNGLIGIENCFFTHMLGLRILDLSQNGISILPDSVSNLVNLTSLLLRECTELQFMPSLASLRKLQELDLIRCLKLKQVPAGLELLSNLRYLELDGINDLPAGLFSHNLCNLEHLGLPYCISLDERLACWGKLDYLRCRVPSTSYFIGMVTDDVQRLSPSNYALRIGEYIKDYLVDLANYMKVVVFNECDIGEGGELIATLPMGFDSACILSCLSLRSLDKFYCVDDGGVASKRRVALTDCNSLECLISPSCVLVPSNIVNHVVELHLKSLRNLRFLILISQPLLSTDVFSCLRVLRVSRCPEIQSLLPLELLTNLWNLEEITVEDCNVMQEIIADNGIEGEAAKPSLLVGEASNSSSHTDIESAEIISLPKLRIFRLTNLPQLKSISSKKMTCGSLEEVVLRGCPRLERVPFFEVQFDNGRPSSLPFLQNLEMIIIGGCAGIVEIIATSGIEASDNMSHADNESAEFVSLPKLGVFRLSNLPQLKSICNRKMSCGSLEEVDFRGCPRLERIPFSLVQFDNGRPSPLPSLKQISMLSQDQEWWDTVEFDAQLPDYKYVLEPLIDKY